MKKPRKRKKLGKQKKPTTMKEDVGKVLVDFSKLVFGSIFLGGFLRGEIPQAALIIGGIVVAVVLCIIGLLLAAKEKKNEENADF